MYQCEGQLSASGAFQNIMGYQTSECAGLFQRSHFECPWHTRNVHSKAAGDLKADGFALAPQRFELARAGIVGAVEPVPPDDQERGDGPVRPRYHTPALRGLVQVG